MLGSYSYCLRTRFRFVCDTRPGAVISMPIGLPPRAKSTTIPTRHEHSGNSSVPDGEASSSSPYRSTSAKRNFKIRFFHATSST